MLTHHPTILVWPVPLTLPFGRRRLNRVDRPGILYLIATQTIAREYPQD